MFLTESFIKTISQKPRKRMFNYYWCQGCVHHEVVSAGSTSSNLLSKYFLPSDAHLSWSCLVIVISRDKTKHAAAGCSRHDRSWHWASELCQAAAVMRHHDRYLCHWASEHCSSANNNAATHSHVHSVYKSLCYHRNNTRNASPLSFIWLYLDTKQTNTMIVPS